jgi:hypothetical protein
MSTWSTNAVPVQRSWLGRAEDWLDDRGKGAWIAAMVLSFILVWPVGLALLAYMIWSKRMFSKSCAMSHRHHHHHQMHAHLRRGFGPMGFRSSGNTAFDAYKAETLDRLQREQDEFEAFLARLRASKDKSEFDAYMDERAAAARTANAATDGEETDDTSDPQPTGRY